MSAKKGKQPDEQFPLSLTEEQREALMEATRLKPALNRLEDSASAWYSGDPVHRIRTPSA